MFLLYIDDSFFGRSDFARDMRYKLRVILKEMPWKEVLVSNAKTPQKEINRFFKEFPKVHYHVSTERFVLEQREWILSNTMLQVDTVKIRPFTGTYCLIDTDTLEYERIYLDFFPQEETDIITLLLEVFQGPTSEYKDKN